MLRFAAKPDQIFLRVIDQAIHEAIRQLGTHDNPSEQEDAFEGIMPASSRLFDAMGAKKQLEALRQASGDEKLYIPTDYHWLLLYEALEAYCEDFNAVPHGALFEEYGIERLDFDLMVDAFFWDDDFLDQDLPDMPLESRQSMAISPETFGLTAGLKPHPEELALKVCDEKLVKAFNEHPGSSFFPGSIAYPSYSDPVDN